jgi:hypothetical protein
MFFNAETWPQVKARAEGPARAARDALLKRCDKYPEKPVCSDYGPVEFREVKTAGGTLKTTAATPIKNVKEWGSQAAECALAWRFTGERKYLDAAYAANDYHCGCNPNGSTFTSGLGTVYPASYLSLASLTDGVGEYIAGITPYRLTYGLPLKAKEWVWNWDEDEIRTTEPDQSKPFGIKRVFMNGKEVLCEGEINKETLRTAGMAIAVK